jgi:cobalamin biosynthetic protein CobC
VIARPLHGGRLQEAARRYGIDPAAWMDLSTGINPQPWPVPPVPQSVWQRLPEDDDGLEAAASAFYGSDALLPLAGSQAAIQLLPALFPHSRVAILSPTYNEHPHGWMQAGHTVRAVAPAEVESAVDTVDVLLLVQPNNPCGTLFPPAQVMDWQARLAARGGTLIVDEAFIDATPEASIVRHAGRPGLVVLRSLGKFFGLAGARVGFMFAEQSLRDALAMKLGPWPVAGPSRWVAQRALADRDWQAAQRARLAAEGARLEALLRATGWGEVSGCVLFQRVLTKDAAALHDAFCRRGILLRLFDAPAALRFGLPADEGEWRRLEQAVEEVAADGRGVAHSPVGAAPSPRLQS